MLTTATYPILELGDDRLSPTDAPALNALNERLRDDFIKDSIAGVDAWNAALKARGVDYALTVPHKAFNRQIGPLAGTKVSPAGQLISTETWDANVDQWLPSAGDREFVQSLMGRVVAPGQFANWISPPASGINSQPVECDYVRFN